jgi:hypothetical protein
MLKKVAMTETGDNLATADVYAGDTAAPDLSSELATNVFLFSIEADADPDVLARVATLFNLANVAPLRATLQRRSPDHVHIIVDMERISRTMADMIRRKLVQLTCVISVDLTEQHTVRVDV